MSGRRHALDLAVLLSAGVSAALAGDHPRLLFSARDVPRLRHVCGIAPAGAEIVGARRFAAGAEHFNALRAYFAARTPGEPLPGELAAAAFLVRVAPADPGAPAWAALLNGALRDPPWLTADPVELVFALDWGWNAIAADVRAALIAALRQRAAPLLPSDSPLQPERFRVRLAALAFAACIDENDDPTETWLRLRRELRDAAQSYCATTFPAFCAGRGLSPTTPAAGPLEECDASLALEFAATLTHGDLWSSQRDGVGRWLEHYVFAYSPHPALQRHFVRDDPGDAATLPAARWSAMTPLTAFLIAARTHDPAATAAAQRVVQAMSGPNAPLESIPWNWAPLVCELSPARACDAQALPLARNLGGAVVFRGGGNPADTIVWIEAGQPFLREGQAFDAGHFLVRRGGELVVGAADVVASEAVPTKGGGQYLGSRPVPNGFAQFSVATAAHNCALIYRPNRAANWRSAAFEPSGGQRVQEGVCRDFTADPRVSPRRVGALTAYGASPSAAYAALDLAAAYDPRDVQAYTREFVFFWRRGLVIIDRVAVMSSQVRPAVRVHLSSRPRADARSLTDAERLAGTDNDAGIWRVADDAWIDWRDRRGAAWLTFAAPATRDVRLAGGPAERLTIAAGVSAGRGYLGGSEASFERLIHPLVSARLENAWYRLGQPTVLGPSVGATPLWGQAEATASGPGGSYLFVTLLLTANADDPAPRLASTPTADGGLRVELSQGREHATLEIVAGPMPGGSLALGENEPAWDFPMAIMPDPSLPLSAP